MTIQEYKNTLQCWLTTFADCGVTTDAIYGEYVDIETQRLKECGLWRYDY